MELVLAVAGVVAGVAALGLAFGLAWSRLPAEPATSYDRGDRRNAT